MSDIPKSKRAHSNLEAHHQALTIRRMIAVELLSSFAYSEKKLEAAIRKQTALHSTGKAPACGYGKGEAIRPASSLVNTNQDAPGYDRWGYRVVFYECIL